MRPLGGPFGGLLGPLFEPLGGLLEASWALLSVTIVAQASCRQSASGLDQILSCSLERLIKRGERKGFRASLSVGLGGLLLA